MSAEVRKFPAPERPLPDAPEPPYSSGNGGGGDMTELTRRVGNLERDMHSVMEMLGTMRLSLERIESTLPHLATKTEVQALRTDMVAGLADKPSKSYMWAILGVLIAAMLGAGALGIAIAG